MKTLAGADQSSTGFSTTFTDQIFFYVPGPGLEREDPSARVLFRHPRREGDQVTDVRSGAALRGAVDLSALRNRPAAPAPARHRRRAGRSAAVARDGCHGRDVPAGARALSHRAGRHRPVGRVVRPVQAAHPGAREGRRRGSAAASCSPRSTSTRTRSSRRRSARSRSRMVVALVAGQPVPLFTGAVPEQQVREVFAQLLQLAAQNGVTGFVEVAPKRMPRRRAVGGRRAAAAAAARRGVRRDRGGRLPARDRRLREGPRREPARCRRARRARPGAAARSRAGRRPSGRARSCGRRARPTSTRSSRSPTSTSPAATSTTRSIGCSTCSRRCPRTSAARCASGCSSCSRSSATPTRACIRARGRLASLLF